jgi:hypothetical protein
VGWLRQFSWQVLGLFGLQLRGIVSALVIEGALRNFYFYFLGGGNGGGDGLVVGGVTVSRGGWWDLA